MDYKAFSFCRELKKIYFANGNILSGHEVEQLVEALHYKP
jgi:uncharacterized protein YuzB (UPF0349 family)